VIESLLNVSPKFRIALGKNPFFILIEQDLAREIARIANLSMPVDFLLQDENRVLTKEEAYQKLSHSASLMKAVLGNVGASVKMQNGEALKYGKDI
jgi:hypothetical protein